MISADRPVQRPLRAKLLVVDTRGEITHAPRVAFVEFLRPGDLMIANDAATLPASLRGEHVPSGGPVEVRLAGRRSLAPHNVRRFSAVVFGAGDYRTRTEDRPPAPPLKPGDRLVLGPLSATVERLLGHPRLVALRFDGPPDAIWAGLARHGRPIQYAHVPAPLALWDVWTPVAGPPVAFEPPSAGFALDWRALAALRNRGVAFGTLTHAAGLSSTGDAELDRRLPFDEPYRISPATAVAIRRARARGGRVVAVGTTVVRALEHAASGDGRVRAGDGLATQRIELVATPVRVYRTEQRARLTNLQMVRLPAAVDDLQPDQVGERTRFDDFQWRPKQPERPAIDSEQAGGAVEAEPAPCTKKGKQAEQQKRGK
jgi:S-adenosylmethionine:tRNA ribosyltransferase-isomerase